MTQPIAPNLQVEAIQNGTVMDHIPAGKGLKILQALQLLKANEPMTMGFNLPSKNLLAKDLIKVENVQLKEEDATQLALFAPDATINIIEDYKVIKKYKMSLPELIVGMFDCKNQNCISNSEPVLSRFKIKQKKCDTVLKCHYCERSFSKNLF
jgi:aspartate carbamoyltransferase regulatory subunit